MTLISVHNSDGCVGRCDSRCYEAQHPRCECVCGGRNHGVWLQQAQDNIREYAREMMEEWTSEHPEDEVRIGQWQLELFGGRGT